MTEYSSDPTGPTNHFEYPPDTPAESSLRASIKLATDLLGDVHHFDGTTVIDKNALGADLIRDLGVPTDATHVRMQTYERTDHSILHQDTEHLGLTLTGRDRYGFDEPVEPYLLSMSIKTAEGNIGLDLVVPSRHFADRTSRARTDAEKQPPSVRLKADVADVDKALEAYVLDIYPGLVPAFRLLKSILGKNTFGEELAALTPAQMEDMATFLDLLFWGESSTSTSTEETDEPGPEVAVPELPVVQRRKRLGAAILTARRHLRKR